MTVADLSGFKLGSQDIIAGSEIVEAPNVRLLIYSDGEHNVGEFYNPFAGISLISGVASKSGRAVNGVMSIYFGPAETQGAKQMEEIAGFCPRHEKVGTIPITKLAHYKYLRNLLHLSSKASGFCIECAKEI